MPFSLVSGEAVAPFARAVCHVVRLHPVTIRISVVDRAVKVIVDTIVAELGFRCRADADAVNSLGRCSRQGGYRHRRYHCRRARLAVRCRSHWSTWLLQGRCWSSIGGDSCTPRRWPCTGRRLPSVRPGPGLRPRRRLRDRVKPAVTSGAGRSPDEPIKTFGLHRSTLLKTCGTRGHARPGTPLERLRPEALGPSLP